MKQAPDTFSTRQGAAGKGAAGLRRRNTAAASIWNGQDNSSAKPGSDIGFSCAPERLRSAEQATAVAGSDVISAASVRTYSGSEMRTSGLTTKTASQAINAASRAPILFPAE